jgi:(p)ppGpp synthase/HD superfamily hydrolase
MRAFWRIYSEYRLEVHLDVRLGYQVGRLADLIQILAHSNVLITDLQPDRSGYHLTLPEASAEIAFRVRNARHRIQVLKALDGEQFVYRVVNDKSPGKEWS